MTKTIKEFVQPDEKIIEIEIERLRSFKDHPFQVKDDKEMYLLKESIEKYGILNGSKVEVAYPEIRITKYTKDFSWGFYCKKDKKS